MVHNVARKLISSKVDSILPDDQSLSVLSLCYQEVVTCLLKFLNLTAVDLMSTKHGFMLASVSLIQRAELITSKLVSLLFPKV